MIAKISDIVLAAVLMAALLGILRLPAFVNNYIQTESIGVDS